MKLAGKRALITGSSQGFGLEVAKKYAAEGASVMLCARDAKALEDARKSVESVAAAGVKIRAMQADIASEDSVTRLVEETHKQLDGLDILVANAGGYGPKGPIDEIDWSEWVKAININLLGTVFCCRAVLAGMKAQKSGKIVILSGGGATKPLPNLSAYAASKAAIVRFAETISEELKPFNIQVNSIAPGALNTRLLDEILAAGPDKVGKAFYESQLKQKATGGHGLERGAHLCVFLGSDASGTITGKLIAAIWDPWEKFPDISADIIGNEIFTLRRIIPSDRKQLVPKEHWAIWEIPE